MTVILTFLAIIAIGTGWWLSQQRLMSKPWLESGTAHAAHGPAHHSAGGTGLLVFVVVIGGLFAMLGSAFIMQIDATPWQLAPLPQVVWTNTGLLVLGSLFMQLAVRAGRQHKTRLLHFGLTAASLATLAFLVGQIEAWRMLTAGGYQLGSAPAASFFYLITGLHGLHILGGLLVLAVIWIGGFAGANTDRMQTRLRLCALYWHALLGVWLVLFALLQGWGNAFLALCRAALT